MDATGSTSSTAGSTKGRNASIKVPFTKNVLSNLAPPGKGRTYFYDEKTAGLALCVLASGGRVFYYYRKVNGRPVRVRLGKFPDISIENARKLAAARVVEVASGRDPQQAKQTRRQEATFGELFERWMEVHAKPKIKTWPEAERLHKTLLKGLDGRKLSAIRPRDIQAMHATVGGKNGQYAANRCLELVRGVFNKAEKLIGWKGENPARGIEPFKEQQRDRFLQADELPRFFRSLNQEVEPFGDFFTLSLLTGARRGNLLAMAWADIDMDRRLWRIPETKSGKPVFIPLVAAAVEILEDRRPGCNGSPWVFPSRSKSGHLEVVKSAWSRILKRAGLSDLRPHDLRRSLGSWMTIQGASLPIVGKALGHLGTSATEVYARLSVDPVRQAIDVATTAMLEAAKPKEKEVPSDGETKE
jgi:integrase